MSQCNLSVGSADKMPENMSDGDMLQGVWNACQDVMHFAWLLLFTSVGVELLALFCMSEKEYSTKLLLVLTCRCGCKQFMRSSSAA